jgi:hypothetical protein
MSQFSIDDTIIFEHDPQRSTVSRRPADLLDLKDFLDHYSLGSLFMAEEVAPQSGGKRNAA